jgi:predicted RNA-binding protein with TRAM domain
VNPVYNHTDEQTICEGETYVFGTQNLTTSGEYTELFESVNGCDSTVVLTLTVNPVYNHTDEQTICEGETYVFGTQNLTTSGEYTEVFESVDGCDSTVVLTLTVNPVYNHTDEQTICEGETYVFGTRNLTTPGEYTHTFTSVNGCDSVVTLTLTVNPVYDETVEATIHEDELPYIFGGESLDESGVYTKTFASVAGCDSIVTLTLTVLEYSVPVAVCNPVTIYLNETGNYSLSRADLENIAAGSSDTHTAFADLILSVSPNAFTCADAGNDVDVMVIVTNEDNYSDTCYTTVSVEDNIAPQVDCRDLEVYLDENGEASIDVKEIFSDSWDACGIKRIYTFKEFFTCDDLGYYYFSVSVTDFNQNKTSCLNVISVFDTIRPVFGTVADIEVAAPEGECKATIGYPEIPVSDNCGVENLFLYEGLGPDGEFPVGTTTERWVAFDASGNSDTLTFEVKISDTPAAPGLNVIPDVEAEEDADWVTVTVTGIFDGSECEEYPLGFMFSAENDQLIASYQTEYITGEEVAYLKLLPSPDATGESNATLTVTNSETGQETGIGFILRITPVNDPPYLVQPVQDLEMKTGDSLAVIFDPEKGIIFDDVDKDDILQLSVRPEDGTTLPEWLVFRNDSLLAFPAAADTGCIELLLVATDLAGEEVNSPFMLCVDFSVGTNLLAEQEIKIYPNPTAGKVYIELSGLANRRADVSVVNILGQKVLHTTYQSEGRWEIDLSNQVSGMYLLKIRGNGIDVNRKIVLNREE